jgi:hypothetical protein
MVIFEKYFNLCSTNHCIELMTLNFLKVVELDVTMLANLKWSDTDNFYMNLGCHKGTFYSILHFNTLAKVVGIVGTKFHYILAAF